jgi:hypothetical protein
LDATTLKTGWNWKAETGLFGLKAEQPNILAVSEQALAGSFWESESKSCVLWALKRGEDWRVLRKESAQRSVDCGVQWVSEEVLLVPVGNRVTFLSPTGVELRTERLNEKEFALSGRSAANGTRVAIPICKSKGGLSGLDISPHVVLERVQIYDLPGLDRSFVLSQRNFDLSGVSGFALSPDGSKLALIRGTSVELYDLPARPSQHDTQN